MVGKLEALAALSKTLAYRAENDSDMTCSEGATGISGVLMNEYSGATSKFGHEHARRRAGLFLAQAKCQGAPPLQGR